jgi:hypothetical protein
MTQFHTFSANNITQNHNFFIQLFKSDYLHYQNIISITIADFNDECMVKM